MLQDVAENQLILAELPYRLEAGTPNIAGIIGFGKVLEWLQQWDFNTLNSKLYNLSHILYKRLKSIKNLQILGDDPQRSTFSFKIEGIHHSDIASLLSEQKIAIRVGEHCAKPYLRYLTESGTLRISLAHYNNESDLDRLFSALEKAILLLSDD